MSIERFMSQVYYNRGCFALSGLAAISRVLPYLWSSTVAACTGRQMWTALSSLLCDEMKTSVVGLVAAYGSPQLPMYRTRLWLIPKQGKVHQLDPQFTATQTFDLQVVQFVFQHTNPDLRPVAWYLP